jgi:V/A-type H+/Na+-transporting ATPase subunit E
MPQELQGLLDRIHKEGIEKTENEKVEILKKAKEEAKAILKTAKTEAKALIKIAKEDAKKNEKKSTSTILQASRDIIISLETELRERLNLCVNNLAKEALTPKLMGEIIKKMTTAYSEDSHKDLSMELIFSTKDLAEMTKLARTNLFEDLKNKPQILVGHNFTTGVKIGFKGENVFFDFSDNTITNIVSDYVGPRLAAILNGEN